MTEEHRIAIGSNSSLGADEVARRSFPTVRKGLDPAAVRAYLEAVAAELRAGAYREDELQRRVEAAERRAATPELDEGTLAAALGVETARVLQSAHEAARQIVERAEARAVELESQAARALQDKMAEGEDGARRLREEARGAGTALVETARADAERLVEATKSECRAMLAEARQVRARVLRDLTERRRVLRVQVEQLLAGRGSLLSAVDSVRLAVDDLTTRLTRAEVEARDAADAAAPDSDEIEAAGSFTFDEEALRVPDLGVAEGGAADVAIREALEPGEAVATGGVFDAEAPEPHATHSVAGAGEPDSTDFEGVTVLGVVPAGRTDDEDVGVEDEGPSEASKAAVDELFAKIRASRAEQVARAREILEAGDDAASAPSGGAGEETAVHSVLDEEEGGAAGLVVEAQTAAEVAAAEPDGEGAGAGEEAAGPHAEAFASRDHLLGTAVARLSRSLKRALQDDQNDLLDRLRHAPAGASLDDVLPHGQQEERYAAAAKPGIEASRKAGASFAATAMGNGKAHHDGPEEGRAAAQRLAEELVSALRLRIEGCLAAAAGDPDSAGTDVVGVAYREWKGSRVAEIAGDHATRSFAAAQLSSLRAAGAAAPQVVWAVDDGGTHCPDCDDNALAGPQTPGETFPTGQQHPPIHPGCRCLLVPVPS